jgi:hypothetical protein
LAPSRARVDARPARRRRAGRAVVGVERAGAAAVVSGAARPRRAYAVTALVVVGAPALLAGLIARSGRGARGGAGRDVSHGGRLHAAQVVDRGGA